MPIGPSALFLVRAEATRAIVKPFFGFVAFEAASIVVVMANLERMAQLVAGLGLVAGSAAVVAMLLCDG